MKYLGLKDNDNDRLVSKSEVTTGGSFPWTLITGTSQTGASANGYITNNAGLVTVSLPTTAAVGEIFHVVGMGAGGWKISQSANQLIHFGVLDTTTGTSGYISSTHRRDSVQVICNVANLEFTVLQSMGNITIV